MFRVFRKIRLRLIDERKLINYFYYAIGEIILVVAGILIALSVNSYYKAVQDKKYEILMLGELESSIDKTLEALNKGYYPRVKLNEDAYGFFYQVISTQRQASEEEALTHLFNLTVHFLFHYDNGAYEALKSNGLDKIENPVVRREIISLFVGALPRIAFFTHEHNAELKNLSSEIYHKHVKYNVPDNGEPNQDNWLTGSINLTEMLADRQFMLLMRKVKEVTYDKRHRLDSIKVTLERNKALLEAEIARLKQ
ncbi:hypothetical protein [Alteromonas lipolytica]|nr:hypothetical protein [Alteromonas lipolytica]